MKMSRKTQLLLSAVTATSFVAIATPSFAQDFDDDVVVTTGTRLNINPNLTSPSPILTIDAAEIKARGVVSIEDLTNSLPQISAAQTADQSNGATGTSQVNLRGLGAQRTLTLLDGRRLPYGDSASIAVNAELIPTNLIESIDVLTGGSSAVYGSDAIGGVVNFILKDDFEGVELDVQYGFAQSSNGNEIFEEVLAAAEQEIPGSVTDGEEITGSITFGANLDGDRGNVTGYASYQNRNEIVGADRTASACTLGASTGAFSANGFGCIGSSNFRRFNNIADFGGTDVFQQEDGTFTPFAGGPAETFNFGASNFFQRPTERFQLHTKAHYDISDDHTLFADFGYTETTSDAQIAPSASFGFFQRSINCDNPLIQDPLFEDGSSFAQSVLQCTEDQIATGLNPDGTAAIIDGLTATHRNVEGGSRNSRLENSAFRIVGGSRGNLGEKFDYEVFAQYSETNDQDTSTEDFLIDNLGQALLVTTDADGNAVCIDQSNGCVPYNIFQRGPNGESLVTQEALDFITGVGITTGQTDQVVIGANIQTDLSDFGLSSPFASESGIGLLVGTEYRRDGLQASPDQISQRDDGGFTGVGGPTLPVAGSLDVLEVFGEIEIPLVTDQPFFHELVFNGQYRYSDYNVNGNGVSNDFETDTYGLQLTWAPSQDVSFRGQFQRAVRAPNVVELFTGQSTGLPDLAQLASGNFDPCATTGAVGPTATAAECANTGVTAAQFAAGVPDIISGQTQGLFGGNPGLTPESSDTFSIGAVFSPSFVDGFTASIDYFDITVDDVIVAGLGAQTILNNCLETGAAQFCDLITRDAAGSLNPSGPGIGFALTNVNAAELATSGIDLQLDYGFDTGSFGDFGLVYASTILFADDFTPFLGADVIECEGEFAGECGQPTADYRHRAIARWNSPIEGLGVDVTWRHFGSVDNDAGEDSADVEQSLDSANYFDVSGSWEFIEGITARAGVNNIFEDDFPVSISAGPANNGNNNTFPGVYDTGRFFFFGLNVKL